MHNFLSNYDKIHQVLKQIASENLLPYQRRKPKLLDLELISLNLTAEYLGFDSETDLFRKLPISLSSKIERSVYNRRKRKLFPYIELIRSKLSHVFNEFEEAIKAMKNEGQHFENSLKDIEKIELVDASIEGTMAELTLRFESHMSIAKKDSDGNIIDGDPEKIIPVIDIWTFCRDVKRGDPNWTLVSTSDE